MLILLYSLEKFEVSWNDYIIASTIQLVMMLGAENVRCAMTTCDQPQ